MIREEMQLRRVPVGELLDVNRCPLCGMESGSTSAICYKHIITYDIDGNIIHWQDDCFVNYEAPYPKFVREQEAFIDAHPELGVKYL